MVSRKELHIRKNKHTTSADNLNQLMTQQSLEQNDASKFFNQLNTDFTNLSLYKNYNSKRKLKTSITKTNHSQVKQDSSISIVKKNIATQKHVKINSFTEEVDKFEQQVKIHEQEQKQQILDEINNDAKLQKKLLSLEQQVKHLEKKLFSSEQMNSYLLFSLNQKDEYIILSRKEIINLKEQINKLELKFRDSGIIKIFNSQPKQQLNLNDLIYPQINNNKLNINSNSSSNNNNKISDKNSKIFKKNSFKLQSQKLIDNQNQSSKIQNTGTNENQHIHNISQSQLQDVNLLNSFQDQKSESQNAEENSEKLIFNIQPNRNTEKLSEKIQNEKVLNYQKQNTQSLQLLYQQSQGYKHKGGNKQFDQKQIMVLIKMDNSDAECLKQWNDNENIQFLSQLVHDEEKFCSYMLHSTLNNNLFLCDKIQKLLLDSKQFFNLILRFKKIIKASQYMTSTLSLSETLEKIVEVTCECLECDRTTIFIMDQVQNELWSKVAKGQNKVIRLPVGKGIAGTVALTKEKLNIYDAYLDERFNKDFDQRTGYKTNNILCIPILENKESKCLGVIQCINKNDGTFTKDDEELLQIISDFSRIVLKNALSFDEQFSIHNKLRLLVQTGLKLFTSPSLLQFLIDGQQSIKDLLNIEDARIVIYKQQQCPKQESLIYVNYQGIIKEQNYQQGSLIALCIQQQNQIFVKNCLDHPQFNPEIDINSSMPVICLPITSKQIQQEGNSQNILGVLQFVNLSGIKDLFKKNNNQIIRPKDLEVINFILQQLVLGIKKQIQIG